LKDEKRQQNPRENFENFAVGFHIIHLIFRRGEILRLSRLFYPAAILAFPRISFEESAYSDFEHFAEGD